MGTALFAAFLTGCFPFEGSTTLGSDSSLHRAEVLLKEANLALERARERLEFQQARAARAQRELELVQARFLQRSKRAGLWAAARQEAHRAIRDDVPRTASSLETARKARLEFFRLEARRLANDARQAGRSCCIEAEQLDLILEAMMSSAQIEDSDVFAARLAQVTESLYEEIALCSLLQEDEP
jgi:hypothetical protein